MICSPPSSCMNLGPRKWGPMNKNPPTLSGVERVETNLIVLTPPLIKDFACPYGLPFPLQTHQTPPKPGYRPTHKNPILEHSLAYRYRPTHKNSILEHLIPYGPPFRLQTPQNPPKPTKTGIQADPQKSHSGAFDSLSIHADPQKLHSGACDTLWPTLSSTNLPKPTKTHQNRDTGRPTKIPFWSIR